MSPSLLLLHRLGRINLHPHHVAAGGDECGHQQRGGSTIGRQGVSVGQVNCRRITGQEFGKQSEDLGACHVSDRSYTLDQSAFVHCPDLIQHNLPGLTFESKRHESGRSASINHGSNDDRVDVLFISSGK